jgi:hypothetical protein
VSEGSNYSRNLSAIKYTTFPRDSWVQFTEQTRVLNGTEGKRRMDVLIILSMLTLLLRQKCVLNCCMNPYWLQVARSAASANSCDSPSVVLRGRGSNRSWPAIGDMKHAPLSNKSLSTAESQCPLYS